MADISWLAQEARVIHDYFNSFFYALITLLLLVGITCEFFKMPLGMPSFGQLVGRAFLAAILLHAYPEITNAIADITDAISAHLGNLNDFKLVLDRMSEKLGELSWSWVSVKDTAMMIISFLTFFLLYFSVHVSNAFYLYAWTLLYVFSPLLIALYVLPSTAPTTSALFRSLIEIATWKIVWSVIATLLWSSALSQINQQGTQISFLTAICFNVILAGSLLLTPFIVHALAGSGLAAMTKNVGALAIGGLALSPTAAAAGGRTFGSKVFAGSAVGGRYMKERFDGVKQTIRRNQLKRRHTKAKAVKQARNPQREFDI